MLNSKEKIAGSIFFIAIFQFILGLIVAELLYPGYNLSENYISDLGIGPSAIVFNISIFILGLLILLGTYFLYKTLKIKILTILLIIIAIGSIGVGIFPENIQPMHDIFAVIVFFFGGLTAIYSYKLMKIPLSIINIILGLITLSAFVLFATNLNLGLGPGGMERIIVYPILIWTIMISIYLLKLTKKS